MPKYTVLVTREITESILIEIEAFDEDAARQYVLDSSIPEIESNAVEGKNWETDGDSRQSGDYYCTSVDEA